MRLSISMSLRNQSVTVEGRAEEGDESVGIYPGIGEYEIFDDDGVLLPWALTDTEQESVQSRAAEVLRDDQSESDFSEREFE